MPRFLSILGVGIYGPQVGSGNCLNAYSLALYCLMYITFLLESKKWKAIAFNYKKCTVLYEVMELFHIKNCKAALVISKGLNSKCLRLQTMKF